MEETCPFAEYDLLCMHPSSGTRKQTKEEGFETAILWTYGGHSGGHPGSQNVGRLGGSLKNKTSMLAQTSMTHAGVDVHDPGGFQKSSVRKTSAEFLVPRCASWHPKVENHRPLNFQTGEN